MCVPWFPTRDSSLPGMPLRILQPVFIGETNQFRCPAYINGHGMWLFSHQSGHGKRSGRQKMVKIVDVEEEHDVSRDEDDCVEIDPAEFAKKLNLKETDDVILVSAKGKVSIF